MSNTTTDNDDPTPQSPEAIKQTKLTQYFLPDVTKKPKNPKEAREQKKRSSSSSSGDENSKPSNKPRRRFSNSVNFSDSEDDDGWSWSLRDIKDYRENYPHKTQKNAKTNYQFYTNSTSSYPDDDFIDNIHSKWFGQYRLLERHHGYIQWLFPIQESGLNWSAEPLQKSEIELMKKNPKVMERILLSYKLMLDFYGFVLVDESTGQLKRSKNWADRFDNLNTSSHNYLRITRILKCLGEFDFEHLKFGFLVAVLYEIIIEQTLKNCLRSCHDYWMKTLFDKADRQLVRQYARDLIQYTNGLKGKPSVPKRPENAYKGRSSFSSPKKVRTGSS